jgi:DnaJ-class molecular chaperone
MTRRGEHEGMRTKDYYVILGVARTESPSGIREAFRDQVKRSHPDRVGPQGTRVFQEVVEAYEVLSDPERRRLYDQWLRPAEGGEELQSVPIIVEHQRQPEPLVSNPLSVLHSFEKMHPSDEAFMARLRRNFTGLGIPKSEQREGLEVEILLTPEEAMRGGIVPLGIPIFSPCAVCGGSGREWLFPCRYCREQGRVEEEKRVRLHIPPRVRDGTIVEMPLGGLGIHNCYLRLAIRLAA